MKIRNDNYFTYVDTKIKKYEELSEVMESPKSREKTLQALEPIKKACAEKNDNILIKKDKVELSFYHYLHNRKPGAVTFVGLEDNLEEVGLDIAFRTIPIKQYPDNDSQNLNNITGDGGCYFSYSPNPSIKVNSTLGGIDNYYQSYREDGKREGLFNETELQSTPQHERDQARYVYGALERYVKRESSQFQNPYHFNEFVNNAKDKMQALYNYPETFNHNKDTREIIKKFIELPITSDNITDTQLFILKGFYKFNVGRHSHHCDDLIVRSSMKEPLSDFIDRLGKAFCLTQPKKTFGDNSIQTDNKNIVDVSIQTSTKIMANIEVQSDSKETVDTAVQTLFVMQDGFSQTEIVNEIGNNQFQQQKEIDILENRPFLQDKHKHERSSSFELEDISFNIANANVQKSISCYQKMVSLFCPKRSLNGAN